MKQLQINDVIFEDNRYHGMTRHVIDRVTKTRAFAGNQGFQREREHESWIRPYPTQHGNSTYRFACPESEDRYEKQNTVHLFRKIKWEEYSVDLLHEIKVLLDRAAP